MHVTIRHCKAVSNTLRSVRYKNQPRRKRTSQLEDTHPALVVSDGYNFVNSTTTYYRNGHMLTTTCNLERGGAMTLIIGSTWQKEAPRLVQVQQCPSMTICMFTVSHDLTSPPLGQVNKQRRTMSTAPVDKTEQQFCQTT